jgi:hypothetical protein
VRPRSLGNCSHLIGGQFPFGPRGAEGSIMAVSYQQRPPRYRVVSQPSGGADRYP